MSLDDATDAERTETRAGILSDRVREMPAGLMRVVLDEPVVHRRDILLGDIARLIAHCKGGQRIRRRLPASPRAAASSKMFCGNW